MMVQMLGVFAEFEREMIVERTKMGLAKKASKGEWTGGKAPFGYGYDAERRLLIPAEDEAPISKEATVKTISLHGTRHTHATLCLLARVPINVVAERLADTIQMVSETYWHCLEGQGKEAAERFATAVSTVGSLA